MIKTQKCKKNGICNNCGKKQSESVEILELKVSSTGKGWNAIMLCEQCMLEASKLMAATALQGIELTTK